MFLEDNIKIFAEGSSIKENLIIDEGGNQFLCLETGKMKYCTLISTQDNMNRIKK